LIDEISAAGGTGIGIQADVSTPEGCEKVVYQLKEYTESLDVLVNVAGGLVTRAKTGHFTWSEMTKVFELNMFSVFYLCSLTVEMLKKSGNSVVINFTSASMRSGTVGVPLYASAKGAVDVYSRSLSRELAPTVRVISICPGVVETPFYANTTTKQALETWAEANPLKRSGTPDEIAHAVMFCIENTFLNGVSIDVNGGNLGV